MPDLSDIISRVEKASGPDHQLDKMIFAAIRGWSYPLVGSALMEFESETRIHGRTNYTSSLDATRSIDPAALCVFASDVGADGLPMVKVVTDTSTSPVIEYTGIAATLELAWCAAILRARQAMQVEPHHER